MKISIIGTGYVGLVLGCCLADFGNDVICMDIDEKKISDLNNDIIPIYEPGLFDIYKRNKDKRILFTTDMKKAVEDSDIIFMSVPTPMGEFHEADLTAVKKAAESIGKYMNDYKVVVNKSTVPIGTADLVRNVIKGALEKDIDFDVVSNPEFLREGAAIKDFQNPDRTVVGADTDKARDIMKSLYKPVARVTNPIIITDTKSAEMIKYASNAMLATRISFMNQLSSLCDKVGADIKQVAKGMGFDGRIGPKFLQAGVGYGGSCFPKDVKALSFMLKQNDCSASLFESVDLINEEQKKVALLKVTKNMDIKGKSFCLWGIAFKPRTDDIREAPSLVVINELVRNGASKIKVYDPVALDAFKRFYPEYAGKVEIYEDNYDAVKDVDALILLTEWDVFRNIDLGKVKSLMKGNLLVDGRNIYERSEVEKLGFVYEGIGR